jgi:hypothetical protein
MSISRVETQMPLAQDVTASADTLSVSLSDGRTISVPLAWFPRLVYASPAERRNWRLIGRGQGIHWEDVDEDISVDGLPAGLPSGESQASLATWLRKRNASSSAGPKSRSAGARRRRASAARR